MSIQESKLKAIADAIRYKDGTKAAIAANDFPARIRAIPQEGGGGGGDVTYGSFSSDLYDVNSLIGVVKTNAVVVERLDDAEERDYRFDPENYAFIQAVSFAGLSAIGVTADAELIGPVTQAETDMDWRDNYAEN